jgi:HAD superfamily hydrolase (TIGR01450 family)
VRGDFLAATDTSTELLHVDARPSAGWAFNAYENIRHRLPMMPEGQPSTREVSSLDELTDRFDGFLFDAFGVLNVGKEAISRAVERFAALQRAGKPCLILSNAATSTQAQLVAKYRAMGFCVEADQVVSSRMVLTAELDDLRPASTWGIVAPAAADLTDLKVPWLGLDAAQPGQMKTNLARAEAVVLLSARGWTDQAQALLEEGLGQDPRPVWVANPDIVSPREAGMALEPGYFAHRLADRTGIEPVFFGKPFSNAFAAGAARFAGIPPGRLLMVGDTLHTDILGGAGAGMATMLVTAHGALQGLDVAECMERAGIHPDFIAPTI